MSAQWHLFSTVGLINAAEQEKPLGKAGKTAVARTPPRPFGTSGGGLLLHLLCKLNEHINVIAPRISLRNTQSAVITPN